jgi:hypothetical protein
MMQQEDIRQLHQLLDGELPPDHEEVLFWKLATEEELRTAFRQLLFLNRLLQREQPIVPASLQESILQRIGLGKEASLWRRPWWVALVSAVGGAGITAALFLALVLPSARQSTPTAQLPPSPPVELSIKLPAATEKAPAPAHPSRRAIAPEPAMPTLENLQAAEAQLMPSAVADVPQRHDLRELFREPASPLVAPLASAPIASGFSVDVAFSLRSLGVWETSSPDVPLPSRSPVGVHNIALGAFAALAPQHALGIEVGSEAFPQEFSSRTGTLYRQRPTLLWAALGYEWSGAHAGLNPFVRSLVGGTVVGPMGKLVVGATLPIGTVARATVGMEGTVLLYRFDNRWFHTRKLGISYGITLGP